MTYNHLSETRAADRQKIAELVRDLALECGAKAEIVKYRGDIRVDISAARGLQVGVDLDGKTAAPNAHVLSWHLHYTSDARLRHGVLPDINPYHRAKATSIAYGTDALLAELRRCLTAARDGSAFEEQ